MTKKQKLAIATITASIVGAVLHAKFPTLSAEVVQAITDAIVSLGGL